MIGYLRPTSISQPPEDTDFRSTPRKDVYVQCGKKMNKQGLPWWLSGEESTWQCRRHGLLAVQGTLRSLLQHHSSKASVCRCSAFFTVQLSHLYMTTGKTTALTIWTFVSKVMSLLFRMLSRFVVAFLPRSKHLLISWCLFFIRVLIPP
uniref:Uncharacterized protein n=1 Tax=Ovis aries TaxID=9940 RepID=A0AC11EV24_SHEEP